MRHYSLFLSRSSDSKISQDVAVHGKYAKFLKPFQIEGIRFLYRRFLKGSGAILNDEEGLGKTVQTVLFLSSVQHISASKTLILCHEDKLNHWLFHFHKWSSEKISLFDEDSPESYFTLATLNQFDVLSKKNWDIIVIDELDPILTVRHLGSIKPRFRIWLASTDLKVQIKGLYKALDWVSGNAIGSLKEFEKTFSSSNEQIAELWKQRQCLNIFCSRWVLRRTNLSVSNQLPIDKAGDSECFAKWLNNNNDSYKSNGSKGVELILNQPVISKPACAKDVIILSSDQSNDNKDEDSPSILNYNPPMLSNNNDQNKRKGKDDSGLKIKKSKTTLNEAIAADTKNLCTSSKPLSSLDEINSNSIQCTTSAISNQGKHFQHSDLNQTSGLADNLKIENVIKVEANSPPESGDKRDLQKSVKLNLFDSLFSDSRNKTKYLKNKIKSEVLENNLTNVQKEMYDEPLADHSKTAVEKRQFKLLDDLFFAPSKYS